MKRRLRPLYNGKFDVEYREYNNTIKQWVWVYYGFQFRTKEEAIEKYPDAKDRGAPIRKAGIGREAA